MPPPVHVLHLSGATTTQEMADLSHLYARDCAAACADPSRWTFSFVDLAPDGTWRFPASLDQTALAAAESVSVDRAVARLVEMAPDVVIPQLFDLPGMTHVRALLDLLDLPYVGNPPHVMALAADKALARAVVAAAGVAVPDAEVVEPAQTPSLSPPVVVKPVDADNSVGVTLVRAKAELGPALDGAWSVAPRALVEQYIPLGREVRCGTLELEGEIVALPLEEYRVDPVNKPIRDASDKLRRDEDDQLHLVAKDAAHAWIVADDDPIVPAVQAAARTCHQALGCRQYGLVDFRIDPAGQPWFLEAGPYCSFAEQSVITTMAAAADIPLPALFAECVTAAIRTHRTT
ncbi:D-alanine--D-alanine ligase family protein [Euzebya tangerina]|uniref:D-alanine--D-alanine ligase family protein n=1 Tax=Euzebya tangerina TaxID=591198 RepID=UPI000E3229C7|nr:D-alanine--D-alanine ligase [Euzebya tangerina]